MHGHTYTVEVYLQSPGLDKNHFVVDYSELDIIGEWVKSELDHRHLNDLLEHPTCEEIAATIFYRWHTVFHNLHSVRVWESPSTYAEYVRY